MPMEAAPEPTGRNETETQFRRRAMRTKHFLLFATAAAAIVAAAPLFPAAAQIDIALGQTVEGRFASSDPTLPDGSHYRIYRFRGTPGQRIAITLRSNDFDAFLAGGSMMGGEFAAEDYDDDSAGGTDARMEAVVGSGGTYYIRANTLMGGETGAYTLRVDAGTGGGGSPATQAAADEIPEIVLGETVRGRFTSSDPTLGDGTHVHVYRYQGMPGERIVITLRSPDFDAFLMGGSMDDGGPGMTDNDDDGAGGTDARIHATVGAGGVYFIGANTLLAGETGSYTLIVEPAASTGSK
jgi:hypothetical protein